MNITGKLNRIDVLKTEIEESKPLKKWNDAFLRKAKFNFTYASNKLEGNTLSYGQTIRLLQDFVTPQNAPPGALLDMINHQRVLEIVFANYNSQYLNVENIKGLHAELMKNPVQWSDDGLYSPGRFKVFENMTVRSTGKIHSYLSPAEVPIAMEKLVNQTNALLNNISASDHQYHPLTIATSFHQEFLNNIHPFSDGNGRIARIFMNLILLKNGYPPIFIKEVDKTEYLKRFELSDDEILPMLDFMADRLHESLIDKKDFIAKQS